MVARRTVVVGVATNEFVAIGGVVVVVAVAVDDELKMVVGADRLSAMN